MEIKLKEGIGKFVFGMRQKDVESIHGPASRVFKDEEDNEVWLYDSLKARLTFYADEALWLGYIISSNPELELFGKRVIGTDPAQAKALLEPKGFKTWEIEEYDMAMNHFNEDHWLILQSEFNEIVKVELGAPIVNDEFVWKFK